MRQGRDSTRHGEGQKMEYVESFFKNHQYTIQFLAAFGTCSAVIVALWLSRISTRPKLHIFVDKQIFIPSEAQENRVVDWNKTEDCICVTVRNVGRVIAYISYFSFSWGLPFPFYKVRATQNPVPDFRKESLKLEPGACTSIVLTNKVQEFYNDVVLALCARTKAPVFMKRFIRLRLSTDYGTYIKGITGKSLKQMLINGVEQSIKN